MSETSDLPCVGNYEQNLYHDSYFYALFWDAANRKIVTEQIGSTAWAGGAYSVVLTTDESVWKEVYAYKAECELKIREGKRRDKAKRLRAARATLKANGVHTAFSRSYSVDDLEEIAALFGQRIRNSFKLAMRVTVKSWRPGGKYKTPLSTRQLTCIRRPLVDMYGRPTALGHERQLRKLEGFATALQFRGLGSE